MLTGSLISMLFVRRLAQAEAIIGIQKKVASLLGIPLATPDSDEEL